MAIKPKGKKVTGTKKADKITWLSSKPWKKALTVNGLAGNDVINFKKSTFKNKLNGGKGNDKIYGGKTIDTIHGNEGNDLIYGYNGNDVLYGDAGNDKIYGGNGNDKIYGGKGNDIINAGKGNNTIYLKKNEGTDTILNGKGKDTLVFADEKNFDHFTFANVGNDLKVTAGGTTAILKGFVTGNSSVKNIKAGNLSFSKIIYKGESYSTVNGTSGNDLFLLSSTYNRSIMTGAGNDIVYVEYGEYDEIYASKGNNYINLKDSYAETIYLKDMMGNNTINTDWYEYFYLDFTENESGSSDNGNEMVRTLQLAEGDGVYNYVIGQKSGNDLIMKTVNNKTVTIKDFYVGSGGYFYVEDESGSVEIDQGSNNNIYSAAPGYIKLTGNDNISSAQNKYIYGRENIAYNATFNSASNNYMDIYGTGNKAVNITNGNNNTISMYSDWGSTTGVCTANITGSKNNLYASSSLAGSNYSVTGNDNYISLGILQSATLNLNGTGNYAYLEAQNGSSYGASATITVNTAGSNEVDLYIESGSTDAYSVTYNVTSTGNDIFHQVNYQNLFMNYHYDFAGSAGKNKEITAGYYNNTYISGVDDTGEIKISTNRAKGYVILHENGSNSITLRDFDWETMTYHRPYPVYYSYAPDIILSGTSEAGLDTTTFANKVKVQYGESKQYNTLNNFVQHFNINSNNFTFGADNVGYLHNLTNDYLVSSTYSSSNNTYSNYQFSTGRHIIYDAGGSADNLTIAEDINNIRMYFNITSEGSILNSDLYFLKSTEFQNFMKGGNVSGYLDIQDYMGAGQIENIQADTYSLNSSNLTADSTVDGSLIADVVSWMSGKGYADTDAVIATGTDADKIALFNIYNNHTDFANNDQNLYWGQG